MSKLRAFIVLAVLTLSVTALSYPAYCFDCSNAEHDCNQEALLELNSCCQLFGCDPSNPAANTYCYNSSERRRCACGLLKACPQPNCGSW
jgi:hypothetical protein